MGKNPQNLDGIFSADDLDLAFLGLGLAQEEEETPAEEDEPRINPLHDMDSLDFHLWMVEEAKKEQARRQAEKQAEKP